MASTISFKPKPKPAADAAAAPSTPAPAAATQVVNNVPETAKVVTAAAAAPKSETVAPAATTSAVAVQAESQLGTLSDEQYGGLGQFEGEFDASEMRIPYLSICGPSSATFKDNPEWLGNFVLNKTIVLGEVIRATFLRAKKFWVEDLPYDPEGKVIPKRFERMADARAAGFREDQVKDSAELDLLIEVDSNVEGVQEIADIVLGDKAYLLARYGVQSTAYGKTVPVLMADLRGFLKGNLINGHYTLTTTKGTGKNLYFYPTLKTDGPTSIELRKAIVARVAPPVVHAEAA